MRSSILIQYVHVRSTLCSIGQYTQGGAVGGRQGEFSVRLIFSDDKLDVLPQSMTRRQITIGPPTTVDHDEIISSSFSDVRIAVRCDTTHKAARWLLKRSRRALEQSASKVCT